MQHVHDKLSATDIAGVVMANGAMSSQQSGEGDIRAAMVRAEAVDAVVALPGQLFYGTKIPACIWILARNKKNGVAKDAKLRDRRGEVLMIDARKMGALIPGSRKQKTLSPEEIGKIAGAYHAWRESEGFEDAPGFVRAAPLEEIERHGFVLTPGRYVGAGAAEEDGAPFEETFARLAEELRAQFEQGRRLEAEIEARLGGFGLTIHTALGPLPSYWSVGALFDLTTKIGSGATPKGGASSYLNRREEYSLIRSQFVYDRRFEQDSLSFISSSQAARLRNAEVRRGDVLINITGDGVTFGRACIAPVGALPAVVNQHVSIIRTDPNLLDPKFLEAFFTHPDVKPYIEGFNAGGSRRAITKRHIERFEVPLPPLPEQRAIAATLGALDDKIELNRAVGATLEGMARALYRSWFVDFDPVRAKMEGRAPAHMDPATAALFPDRLDEDGLSKGWAMGTLGDIMKFNPGEKLKKGAEAPYSEMKALPTSGALPDMPFLREFTCGTKFRVEIPSWPTSRPAWRTARRRW